MKKPNFFLIGAPRCGTTAMCRLLSGHPDIFMPRLKEPHFFATDLPAIREAESITRYMQIFDTAGDQHSVVVDGSPLYLYSSVAVAGIREFNADAQFLVMLRNPVDMLYSYHARRLATFSENEPDFGTAWRRRDAPASPVAPLDRFYSIAKFGEQLQRVLKLFPRKQVHVVLFDDFLRSQGETYRSVLHFAGLSESGSASSERTNPNIKSFRAGWLMKQLRHPPQGIRKIEQKIKSMLGIQRFGLIAAAEKLLGKRGERTPIPESLRAEILDEHRDDIKLLSTLIDRDLQSWLSGDSRVSGPRRT